jgi:hypothetical protein
MRAQVRECCLKGTELSCAWKKALSVREWISGFHDLLRDTLTIKCAAHCIGFPCKLVLDLDYVLNTG